MPNRRLVRKDQLKMASRSLVLMFVLMVSLVIVSQGVLAARELAEKTKGNIYHPCADALSLFVSNAWINSIHMASFLILNFWT